VFSLPNKCERNQKQSGTNPFLRHVKKAEFVVTYACTGRCRHCSEGDHPEKGDSIDPTAAADAITAIASMYPLKTVMAFGGEPLLYPHAVYTIMEAARHMGVPHRQVITNGYFSKNTDRIREVSFSLAQCGVNDLLLSADAFHQETIPLETVKTFAIEAREAALPIRIQPAWLVSREADNPFNRQTRAILEEFRSLGFSESEGNIVFPEGNARVFLAEYLADSPAVNPYEEDLRNLTCISFEPNGDVLGQNLYQKSMADILKDYAP